ncbi:uncharacterized protein LOC134817918 [Bolinopsis microptera]|uniref:uncharacterized protein LOC134817918 n=1 Tax=Bolinopsis microptera TaxID=2820187 RepID=UPI003078E807
MRWDLKEFTEPEGANYTIVYQATQADGGREFVIAYFHPVTGELFLLRGIVKDDKVTILNTDKFDQEHLKLYITFYIKDPELQVKIFEEIEANPTWTIMILYKYGVFAEAVDLASMVTHISAEDADNKPVESKDKEDDEHVRKAREAQKKAEEKGKKGTGPPEDGKPWSCGKVKWELPKEEKKFRDVGKLKIPDFGAKEEEKSTKDVGKLKWDGFSAEEPKEVVKEKPKVGKLNLGAFGGAPAEAKAPVKRSWKKKEKTAEENGAK